MIVNIKLYMMLSRWEIASLYDSTSLNYRNEKKKIDYAENCFFFFGNIPFFLFAICSRIFSCIVSIKDNVEKEPLECINYI